MDHWIKRVLRRARCWKGHSDHIVINYFFAEDEDHVSVIDDSVVVRCARCGAVLPSSTCNGIVSLPRRVGKVATCAAQRSCALPDMR